MKTSTSPVAWLSYQSPQSRGSEGRPVPQPLSPTLPLVSGGGDPCGGGPALRPPSLTLNRSFCDGVVGPAVSAFLFPSASSAALRPGAGETALVLVLILSDDLSLPFSFSLPVRAGL